jgi:hypothetical protein
MKILAFLFFLIFTAVNGFLFYIAKVTAGEAITFFTLCSVISLMLFFSSEVQEFSIAGNIVKLKEVRKDAEKAIDELKASRLTMFRFLLESTKKFSGGFGSISPKDERIDDFLFLFENIEDSGLFKELADKIAGCADLFMKAQLRNSLSNYVINIDFQRSYTPDELTFEALKTSNIRQDNGRNEDENRKEIMEAVSHYRTLYNIFQKTKPYTS